MRFDIIVALTVVVVRKIRASDLKSITLGFYENCAQYREKFVASPERNITSSRFRYQGEAESSRVW